MSFPLSRRCFALAAVVAGAVVGVVPITAASADPSASAWYQLRQCESSNNYATNTGNGHYGAYQFDVSTWRSVGGHGLASDAARGEQDARALILYRERGWQPWQCADILGLREDADAGSGRISDIKVPVGAPTPAPSPPRRPTDGVPAYPSTRAYTAGVTNSVVARWQKQMARRGAPLHGTGAFGPVTTAVLKALQTQNGLAATGVLDQRSWRLAWTGTYRTAPAAAPHSPAWPGVYFGIGSTSPYVAVWQRQMHARGVTSLRGSGVFGPNTLAAVKSLQVHNGLPGTGILGPNTWKLAWTGRL